MSQVQIEKKKTGGDVAVKSEAPTPTLDVSNYINEFGGAGLENVTSENMAMPFIKLISDGSPERNRTSDKFIEVLFDNLIIEISNCVMQIIINEFSIINSIRQVLYKSN